MTQSWCVIFKEPAPPAVGRGAVLGTRIILKTVIGGSVVSMIMKRSPFLGIAIVSLSVFPILCAHDHLSAAQLAKKLRSTGGKIGTFSVPSIGDAVNGAASWVPKPGPGGSVPFPPFLRPLPDPASKFVADKFQQALA